MTYNDLQNPTQKTKGRAAQTPLKLGMNSGALEWVSHSCSTSSTCRATLVHNCGNLKIWSNPLDSYKIVNKEGL